jgi:3D-(3,5/4)-trihydroxycyclohexane-1,2-dione acylhydrolase (decyclizing)
VAEEHDAPDLAGRHLPGDALRRAVASERTTVVHVETDPRVSAPSSEAWWDVPVAEVSELDSTRAARAEYEEHKTAQRTYLAPAERVESIR